MVESKQATAPLDAEETKKLEIFGMQKITKQNTGVCLNQQEKNTAPPKLGGVEVEHFETSSHRFFLGNFECRPGKLTFFGTQKQRFGK